MGQPWANVLMDFHNNSIAREAGRNHSSVDPGELWMLPPNNPHYNPLFEILHQMRHLLMAICAVLSVLVMASCTPNKGVFLLFNESKEPISRGIISICGQTIELKDIQPNKSAQGSYEVKFDSHYDIRIKFQSGKELRKELGYVTNGLDFHHKIVVTDTDIKLMDNKAN